jgi:hypothetical protein
MVHESALGNRRGGGMSPDCRVARRYRPSARSWRFLHRSMTDRSELLNADIFST